MCFMLLKYLIYLLFYLIIFLQYGMNICKHYSILSIIWVYTLLKNGFKMNNIIYNIRFMLSYWYFFLKKKSIKIWLRNSDKWSYRKR